MKVLQMPLSKKIGITNSDKPEYLLKMNYSKELNNHLNTMHGVALYALAEISSGEFLNKYFHDIADVTIPVLRTSKIKYKKESTSDVYSKAKLINTTVSDILLLLEFKKKCMFVIEVKIYNSSNQIVLSSEFEWFVKKVK